MNVPMQKKAADHRFDPTIFREYDIRGIAEKSLRAEDVYWIGRAFGSKAAQKGHGFVCVGYDGRLSSPILQEAVCKGITDSGMDVVNIGLGPTPMLYFVAYTMKAAGGIMITGSHNPPDHNGMKFVLHNKPFYGADIQALQGAVTEGTLGTGKGNVRRHDVRAEYIRTLVDAYDGNRDLSIAWDAGNGATGDIMSALCKQLPGKHVALNAVIDGTFPSHHPDPTVPENLVELQQAVAKGKLDIGVAFDGDGDRLGIVDDEGAILWGDQLLMLYGADILKDKQGATIIADVKASGALFEEIERLGGKPLMWKTGHSLIKAKMAETKAPLAGEMSGHLFFADKYYGYDDGIYAAVRLLGLLSRSGKKLSDLRKALPARVNTPEIRFECGEARKFEVISEVKARLQQQGASFSDVDGVRVNTPDGWWLLRASNTQALLVARCEAKDQGGLVRLKDALSSQLAASNVSIG